MAKQNKTPKQVNKSKKETPKTPDKKIGVVKQIEEMIVSILKETPKTRKDLLLDCPLEYAPGTWSTRISRLKNKGIIYQDESKLLKVKE